MQCSTLIFPKVQTLKKFKFIKEQNRRTIHYIHIYNLLHTYLNSVCERVCVCVCVNQNLCCLIL